MTDTVKQLKKDCKKHKVKGYSKCKNKKELIDFCHEKIKQQHINKLMMINKLSKIQSKKYNPVALVFKQELFMTKINNFLCQELEMKKCMYDYRYIKKQKFLNRDPIEFPNDFIQNDNIFKKKYLELCDFSKKIYSVSSLKKINNNNIIAMQIYVLSINNIYRDRFDKSLFSLNNIYSNYEIIENMCKNDKNAIIKIRGLFSVICKKFKETDNKLFKLSKYVSKL